MLRWDISEIEDGFELRLDGKLLLRHKRDRPFLSVARGEASYRMYRGNFRTRDRQGSWTSFPDFEIQRGEGGAEIILLAAGDQRVRLALRMEKGQRRGPDDRGLESPPGRPSGTEDPESLVVEIVDGPAWANRWRLALLAEPDESVYGCGEQFSRFDLRGKKVPLWTSEQGVGRNKLTLTTIKADLADGAGGDWWWTFFPQPSYSTSRRLRVHLETDAWSEFDFRRKDRFSLLTRQRPRRLVFGSAPSMQDLAAETARYFGLQPEPPEWLNEGVTLGIQGGMDVCRTKLEAARAAGVPVSAIWAQDWAGVRHTSFGKRLSWNWELDSSLYPDLQSECERLGREGLRFLAYVNCYFACDKPLFAELDRLGLLVKDRSGASYRMDAGEFDAGIPDLTNPAAREWFKSLIKRNLLDLGIAGWMADFGEYLPADCVLFDGSPAEFAHNLWPSLWARVNREAVEASLPAGSDSEPATFFMRAGFTGSQRWCPHMWAGDQNVDWSRDDGLPSVIPAALSLAMVGHGYHHSDIGGYTTLFHLRRTKELFLRWSELAAFTVWMRSHEGNRPASNWQFDSDAGTLAGLARMGRLRVGLAPYFRSLSAECSTRGTPLIRPLFFSDEGDREAWRIQDQFLLGPDLLVAPVLTRGATRRRARILEGNWVHLWTGAEVSGRRWVDVPAPVGEPPAWYRAGSRWADTFLAAVRSARGREPKPRA